MDQILTFFENNPNLHIPSVGVIDVVEIAIISLMVYHMLVWMKNTRAWSLMKGIVSIMVMFLVAALFEMNTIIWIAQNVVYIGVIAVIVVLQPELRKALETLGKKNFIGALLPVEFNRTDEGLFSDKTIREITKACVEMAKVKTGALIVICQNDTLLEYEATGIEVDGVVTSQLLINIFEHNTPLHDGAVIIKGDRIVSATCYLPLSDNMELSKDLGTRHRAGVGISEATDSLTLIVSEETGKISAAYKGELTRGLRGEDVEKYLEKIQNKPVEEKKRRIFKVKIKDNEKGKQG
ncbi:MAG: diadenylate cyclase CdaA [Lachnospiraceae bacterium]|nr:diadenylate cyclase CdaA [Lachnospiraceae bacterium]MDD7026987.1 diadenylate cyclase CdaA [Lachnospiraceae bacterium]